MTHMISVIRNAVYLFGSGWLLIPFFCASSIAAQTYTAEEVQEPANYAFASYIGSGFYQTDGQTVMVFNMPFSYQPNAFKEKDRKLRMPVSVGFYNFTFDDIPEFDIPGEAATLSAVPGIQQTIKITDKLSFVPYFDLGVGHNFRSQNSVLIYSAGVSSWYEFGEKDQMLWLNKLLYAGYKGLSYDVTDGFALLQSGLDYKLPVSFRGGSRQFQVTTYALVQWYFNSLRFIVPDSQLVRVNNNVEFGFSLVADKKFNFYLFGIDHIGFGYRAGDGLQGWRISFRIPIE